MLILLVLAALARAEDLWQPWLIMSEAMKPTLLVGDYVISTSFGALARGDVVAIRVQDNATAIRRLVGLPGDRVQMIDGHLWLNGVQVPQAPDGVFSEIMGPQGAMGLRPRCQNAPVADGDVCTRARDRETLPNGRSYEVLNIRDGGPLDNTVPVVVPDGALYVLGDNRDNSLDSRISQEDGGLGLVPMTSVLGKLRMVLFSTSGPSLWDPFTLRAGRFVKSVE